jgi:bifunctional non-homologous end joining protein LigD
MSLVEYRRKRDFRKTSEPSGKRAAREVKRLYIVQKHDASHLHYDFRLQIGDVLKSWAVPKGPSLDPNDKRLAIEVEDHPLDYGSFEGVIPEGEYGGGTVMLWDRGHWEPLDDAEASYRAGKLKFELHGEKLRGIWNLVRSGRSPERGKPQWFLIKHRDDEAHDRNEVDVTAEEPLSVASGRDLEEIAADRDRVWGSDSGNGRAAQAGAGGKRDSSTWSRLSETRASLGETRPRAEPRASPTRRRPAKARTPTKAPAIIQPELATLVKQPPAGDQWVYEIKFDGYRIIGHVAGDKVRFQTRNELDWTTKMPQLAEAVRRLKLRQAIFDGEIVVFDEHGVSQFQLLQNAFREAPGKIVYTIFDLLFFQGEDLRDRPLEERKELLASLQLPTDRGPIRYTEHFEGDGGRFLEAAREKGLEGIICKRRDRPYVSGRTTDWLKCKTHQTGEFVIGGYTDPAGSRKDFGALLVGYHDGKSLRYAGRVGTGFTDKTLGDLLRRLKPLAAEKSPFTDFPVRGRGTKGVHWVRPELVAQVEFSNWTGGEMLRHPSFQGVREDKPASEVTREVAKPRPSSRRSRSVYSSRSVVMMPRAERGRNRRASSRRSVRSTLATTDESVFESVRLTHPDKLLYPDAGITKRDFAEYYVATAERMLPHVAGRPLTIVRCPDGVEKQHFLQKHLGTAAPPALRRVKIRDKQEQAEYCVVDDVSGLVALAQIAALEIHVWGARVDGSNVKSLERPDRLVFDLDPAPDVKWPRVIAAAIEIRDFLQELKLESFVKTSGGKGLHLVVPIERRQSWDAVKAFCRSVAVAVERAAPDRYVSTMSKKARTGKIYIDYGRNDRGATAVAPFSTRAKPGAPVSLPISWRELPRTTAADQFHLREVLKRLSSQRSDPWAGFADVQQSISADAVKALS